MHLINVQIACFAPITGTQWLDFRRPTRHKNRSFRRRF